MTWRPIYCIREARHVRWFLTCIRVIAWIVDELCFHQFGLETASRRQWHAWFIPYGDRKRRISYLTSYLWDFLV
jgi:hypothetical protein